MSHAFEDNRFGIKPFTKCIQKNILIYLIAFNTKSTTNVARKKINSKNMKKKKKNKDERQNKNMMRKSTKITTRI